MTYLPTRLHISTALKLSPSDWKLNKLHMRQSYCYFAFHYNISLTKAALFSKALLRIIWRRKATVVSVDPGSKFQASATLLLLKAGN
jgi:hypothetical protein